jgi:hypothetical protein
VGQASVCTAFAVVDSSSSTNVTKGSIIGTCAPIASESVAVGRWYPRTLRLPGDPGAGD